MATLLHSDIGGFAPRSVVKATPSLRLRPALLAIVVILGFALAIAAAISFRFVVYAARFPQQFSTIEATPSEGPASQRA